MCRWIVECPIARKSITLDDLYKRYYTEDDTIVGTAFTNEKEIRTSEI
jgi:hypothetical protein